MRTRALALARAPAAAALLLAVGGCGGPAGETLAPLPAPDRALFAVEASGILEKSCGSSNCHGRAERPYPLYARRQRRRPPIATFSTLPLAEDEIDANYRATLGFLDHPDPRQTTFLRKALGTGGTGGHRGGAVFEGPSDPQCRAVEAWLKGTTW